MAKKQTKAQKILGDAGMRVRQAEAEVGAVRENLRAAEAALKAHRDAYQALDLALASKPRVSKPKKDKTMPAQKTLAEAAGK